MRSVRAAGAAALAAALLTGCASPVPQDDLLASTEVVAELAREAGEVVEVGAFSRKQAGADPEPWRPYIILPSKPRTTYRLERSDVGVVLAAEADRSASGKYRRIRIDPARHPVVEWRWRVPRLIEGADPRNAAREDSPARLFVSFHGDPAKLDFEERTKLRLAKALSGQKLPYATLMYVWSNDLPPGTVVHNPHSSRIRMIVVESGSAGLGRWRALRRNVREDYKAAFGEEPWDIVAVGVMTDTDNTRTQARAWYGDIVFRRE